MSDCLTVRLSVWLSHWLTDRPTHWLTEFGYLIAWLPTCLFAWLIDWLIGFNFFQIQQYSRNIEELKNQLGVSQEKLQKQSQEAARRDEQLVVLKVELATLQEKHRLIQDEVIQRFLINIATNKAITNGDFEKRGKSHAGYLWILFD